MYSAREIAQVLDPVEAILVVPDSTVDTVIIDSRQGYGQSNAIFVALRGTRTDGHLFLGEAWSRGIRNFIVAERPADELPDSNIFLVPDTVRALQQVAMAHRAGFGKDVIGITGSNGKTWVKDWLYFLMEEIRRPVKSPRSYNSQIGVPLSVLQLRSANDIGIFEAGVSASGEMEALEELIRPTIGVFTNLGDAHDMGFPDRGAKLREKCRLFKNTRAIVYPADYPEIAGYIERQFSDRELISWGYSESATLRIKEYRRLETGIVKYQWNGRTTDLVIPHIDQASWYNAMTCCAVLEYLGFDPVYLAARVSKLPSIRMRLDLHRLPDGGLVINDTYSFDLASFKVGLDSLAEYGRGLGKAVIMTEIEQQPEGVYSKLADLINKSGAQYVFGLGNEASAIDAHLNPDIVRRFFGTFDEFIRVRPWESLHMTAFLVKGARRFQLERLVDSMKQQTHSALLQIDLNALLSNLQFFISKLRPGTGIIAMVKAAAYGSGGAEVARFLEYHNVTMLAVAYADEGVDLRKSGSALPILIMNPESGSIDRILRYDLEPEVYDLEFLDELNTACGIRGKNVNIHLKIDTGMHRLGFDPANLGSLIDQLSRNKHVHVKSIFTHLAAAGDPDEMDFTRSQIEKFENASNALEHALGYRPFRHVLNSGGIIHHPQYQYDAVRLGIGLYGTGLKGAGEILEPVHTFSGRISQIHEIRKGESVGYDRAYIASSNMRIATVNIGYADGLPRLAGKRGYALLVKGKPAPVVGNICMDMCMIDISEINEAEVGAEVVVFGPDHRIESLALACETIPYEILTGISDRIPRVFKFGW